MFLGMVDGYRPCPLIHNTTRNKYTFENIVGKGEDAANQHLLLFPQCFLIFHRHVPILKQKSCANAFQSEHAKKSFCLYKAGLNVQERPLQYMIHLRTVLIPMGECNTILSAYTKYRHLG